MSDNITKKKSSSTSQLEAEGFLTLKYMTRFSCIGNECEEHCCKSWKVYVDEDHYKA